MSGFSTRFIRSTLTITFFLSIILISECSSKFQVLKTWTPLSELGPDTRFPAFPSDSLTSYSPTARPGFVTVKDKHFYLNDQLFDFRSFNAPDLLSGGTVYQAVDTFRTINGFGAPVTRTYTLGVANEKFGGNQPIKKSHILGWDPATQDWQYNEVHWQVFDKVLDSASKEGVKIIFPIINQDYGKEEEDWAGNFNDLVRHRYNISNYKLAELHTDFFTDQEFRNDYKKIIQYLLTRRNTVNGRIYGQDDTFFAFETGNEMNWKRITMLNVTATPQPAKTSPGKPFVPPFNITNKRPAPAEWTIDIAKYIKTLAPQTLVIDGSFARNLDPTQAWPVESLQSPYIDVFSYHFYGDIDLGRANLYKERVESFGKVFIAGEHGFYSNSSGFESFYRDFKGAGALVWSLRPHSETSGFDVHGEGNNIYSYHVPGWKNITSEKFDQLEADVVRFTYQASYDILGLPLPQSRIPTPPYAFFASNGTNTGISFKGAAWADRYEVWGAGSNDPSFVRVADNVFDSVESGQLFIAVDPSKPTEQLYIPPLSYVPYPGPQTGWTDDKWADGPLLPGLLFRKRALSNYSISSTTDLEISWDPHHIDSLDKRTRTLSIGKRGVSGQGGWYCVRGISVDGQPGYFSQPAFVSASDDI